MVRIDCPYCDELVEAPRAWAIKNERLFCNSCCKSFEVEVQSKEEQNEETEPAETFDKDYQDGYWGM